MTSFACQEGTATKIQKGMYGSEQNKHFQQKKHLNTIESFQVTCTSAASGYQYPVQAMTQKPTQACRKILSNGSVVRTF